MRPLRPRTAAPRPLRGSRRRGARALAGPCTAITARVSVTSAPPMAPRTRSVFEALGMTSNESSRTHHTMMSSSTDASSSSRCVYWARPTPILPRSFVNVVCNRSMSVGTRDPHRAEVADVERDSVGAARHVLGERARRVREGHRPAAEVDELGAELAMLARRVESGAARSTSPDAPACPPCRTAGRARRSRLCRGSSRARRGSAARGAEPSGSSASRAAASAWSARDRRRTRAGRSRE